MSDSTQKHLQVLVPAFIVYTVLVISIIFLTLYISPWVKLDLTSAATVAQAIGAGGAIVGISWVLLTYTSKMDIYAKASTDLAQVKRDEKILLSSSKCISSLISQSLLIRMEWELIEQRTRFWKDYPQEQAVAQEDLVLLVQLQLDRMHSFENILSQFAANPILNKHYTDKLADQIKASEVADTFAGYCLFKYFFVIEYGQRFLNHYKLATKLMDGYTKRFASAYSKEFSQLVSELLDNVPSKKDLLHYFDEYNRKLLNTHAKYLLDNPMLHVDKKIKEWFKEQPLQPKNPGHPVT